ncbi:MAG: DUF3995 domain-containing protein [Yoonia sp.]|uniref:DUF3995 domain-containing protein n=1 Tax=Yoonia sp. TaxID=2212373 RepID=UPI00273FB529|nr:DUF3995 domain-containing protein [Yoonia sp.]MDP5085971.1 DUF3995 domain-containing protein [Yoonia sp.]MDP5361872.1 DUF3995 domain-containing protein [Paracoccaceae bacterium]
MTILLTALLSLIAAMHLAWAFHIWIPIRDEVQLAHAVVGAKGVTRMPGTIPCLLVAGSLAIVIAALWMPSVTIARVVLWLAALVFAGRGLIAYAGLWRKMTPEEPFATYDQRYYGPLCLVLAAGLLFTLIGG